MKQPLGFRRKRDRRLFRQRLRALLRLKVGFGEAIGMARQPHGSIWLHRLGPLLLERVVRAAERADCPLVLCWGTLLGQVRDGGFIAHDNDIDLGLLPEYAPRLDALEAELAAHDLTLSFYSPWMAKIAFRGLDAIWADIWIHHAMGDDLVLVHNVLRSSRTARLYRFPAALLRETIPATLMGVDVRVPARFEEVLSLSYGAWRTPDPAFVDARSPCGELLSLPIDMALLFPDRPWPPRWRRVIGQA